MALAARQSLELFVGLRNTVAAHHGLNGFGEHFPGAVDVVGNNLLVEFELAQTTFQGFCS